MRSVPEYGPGALVLYTALALVTLCVAAHWRRAGRRAREMAAREQAHADALAWDAIMTAAYTRGHEHGRVSGRRIGYDAGHADGCLARANGRAQLNLPRHAVGAFRGFGGRIGRQLRDTHHPPAPPPGFNDSEGDEG